jgi:hypothetical protein
MTRRQPPSLVSELKTAEPYHENLRLRTASLQQLFAGHAALFGFDILSAYIRGCVVELCGSALEVVDDFLGQDI